MTINPIKKNMTELDLGTWKVLFSYRTPVAGLHVGHYPSLYITSKKWSNTTTRHVNQWLDGRSDYVRIDQEFFDGLLSEVL